MNGARTATVTKLLIFSDLNITWHLVLLNSPLTVNMDTFSGFSGLHILQIVDSYSIPSGQVAVPDIVANTTSIPGYPEHNARVKVWNTNILRAGRSKLPGLYLDKESDADFTRGVP